MELQEPEPSIESKMYTVQQLITMYAPKLGMTEENLGNAIIERFGTDTEAYDMGKLKQKLLGMEDIV